MKKLTPTLLIGSISLLANSVQADLASIGLPDPIHHFPVSITDTSNTALQICNDGDGVTGPCIFDPVTAGNAWSATTGFGAEAFYNLANARLTMPNTRTANLVLAVEAAYLNGTPTDGQQFVFGRIRIRIDAPGPGVYQVYHPYMTYPGCQPNTYTIANGDVPTINETLDIGGGSPFEAVLASETGPFLRWDPAIAPLAPPGYVGNPQIPHAITGSECGMNVFRIDGPDIGGPGVNTVSTNLFTVSGKLYDAAATPSPLVIDRATYTRTGTTTRLNVFAQAAPTATVTLATVSGLATDTLLTPDTKGNFFTQVSGEATPPANVTLSASNPTPGLPATVVNVPVTDQVEVLPAVYDDTTKELFITAKSSDNGVPPILTATVGKTPVTLTRNDTTGDYSATVTVATPPVSVTVMSSKGGKDVENIDIMPPVALTGCAQEEQPCVVPAGRTALVVYGANDQYVLLKNWSGTKWCSAKAFGKDPIPGTAKTCSYLEYGLNGALPTGSVPCATDNGVCSIPSGKSAVVYYGAPNGAGGSTPISYGVRFPVTGTINCNTAIFGDPAPGRTDKSCTYFVVGDALPPPPVEPPSAATPLSPVLCAGEEQPCAVPNGKTAAVMYGANNQYTLLGVWSGAKWCSAKAFGVDPIPGVAKNCAYIEYGLNGALPPGAVFCAPQDGVCNIPADKQAIVYYGAPNGAGGSLPFSYSVKYPVTGSINCSNAVFGEPAPGRTDKSCAYVIAGQPDAPTPPPPPVDKATAVTCAAENQACVVPTGKTAVVAYGANNQYALERAWTGSKWCSAAAFGKDPIPGTPKSCTYIEYGANGALPTGSVLCAQERGTCFIPNGKQAIVYYGAPNGTGGTQAISYRVKYPVSSSIACNTNNFGDPAPGLAKSCSYLLIP